MQIVTKRIYEPASPGDGFRVLVDRLWPRGVSQQSAAVDLWAREVGPTTKLRKWFSHDPERFVEFANRYQNELGALEREIETVLAGAEGHETITLLYAAKDIDHNNAAVLKEWLEKFRSGVRPSSDSASD